VVDALAYWTELVARPEPSLPLGEAALVISAAANPGLDVASQLTRLDELASRVPEASVSAVCSLLFEQFGIAGDRQTYDDPANSFLDRVLDRRRGIPISMSVLLIEVAARCGIPLEPVGMPGHFLVRDPSRPHELIDAFEGGHRLDVPGAEKLLRRLTGSMTRLTKEMLATTPASAVLARMLANLDGSYERREDTAALRWVSELRRLLPGAPVADRTQLASRLARLGRWDAAASVLESVGASLEGTARQRVLAEAVSLRARLN
jgi:regulator of sirC expression with transglutaminase-like and TPR domain